MYKIIGGDKQVYGPVSADELRRWIAEGRVNAQTQVQAEGSSEWKPISAFAEFADALAPHYPVATQPLISPAAPVAPLNAEFFTAEILDRPAELRIGSCCARSWNLFMANVGLFLGACAIIFAIKALTIFVPMAGLAFTVLHGVIFGGLYLIFLKRMRGQPAAVGDVFSGFSSAFVKLLLVGLVSFILSYIGFACCLILPGLYLMVAWIFSVPLVADKRLEFWSAMELSRKVVNRVWFQTFGLLIVTYLPFLVACVLMGLKLAFTAIPQIQDIIHSGSQPDPKMITELILQIGKTSAWISVVVSVVLLFNLPFASGALMYAYEDLFGTRPASAA